jgi:hypothetical protein
MSMIAVGPEVGASDVGRPDEDGNFTSVANDAGTGSVDGGLDGVSEPTGGTDAVGGAESGE